MSALLAVAASAALYAQYLNPADAAFCGMESGCEAVRRSGYSYFGHPLLSLPLAGLLGFGAVYLLSLFRPKHLVSVASIGGAAALVLLYLQKFDIGQWCWLCVTVDVLAIATASFAWLHRGGGAGVPDPLPAWTWLGLAALALVAPPLWSAVKRAPPVPAPIRALYVPGKINVVEFGDFQCPFCRALHPVLKAELAEFPPDRLNVVRMNVPLPSHEYAAPAARAHLCAKDQGKGEAMADELMGSKLGPDTPERLAAQLGLDSRKFERCMLAQATEHRVDREIAVLEEAGFHGLPTTYIGGKRFIGNVSAAAVRDALARAEAGDSDTGVPGAIYLLLVSFGAAAVVWFGRRSRGNLHHGAAS